MPMDRLRSAGPRMAGGFGAPQPPKEKSFGGRKTFEQHMRQYRQLLVPGYPPPNQVDVYVHAAGDERFWFVGKVCAREGLEDGAARAAVKQKRLVLEHAKVLQPRHLGRAKGQLELWCAPANSEMRVAQRQQELRRLGLSQSEVADIGHEDVGYLPEQYNKEDTGPGGTGFYVRLPPDGKPNASSSVRIVSPEEAKESGFI